MAKLPKPTWLENFLTWAFDYGILVVFTLMLLTTILYIFREGQN